MYEYVLNAGLSNDSFVLVARRKDYCYPLQYVFVTNSDHIHCKLDTATGMRRETRGHCSLGSLDKAFYPHTGAGKNSSKL